ncbi:hypothetical protein CDAR_227741 [Caerostris darwini]|uniref:Uncharacterized protein n=1 Tax=Caerostris darwini TaxID=1538125 RepID=A0AAV4WKX1_9ARAC|nr:hypothetical protein CDAR_227741 [Caerostris darwini]
MPSCCPHCSIARKQFVDPRKEPRGFRMVVGNKISVEEVVKKRSDFMGQHSETPVHGNYKIKVCTQYGKQEPFKCQCRLQSVKINRGKNIYVTAGILKRLHGRYEDISV